MTGELVQGLVIEREIARYVHLQYRLVGTIQAQYHTSSLLSVANAGRVVAEGSTWSFSKHGSGVRFKSVPSGIVVDVHNEFQRPDLFDHWRLRTYFGSLRKEGARMVKEFASEEGPGLDVALERALAALLARGRLVRVGSHYQLCEDAAETS